MTEYMSAVQCYHNGERGCFIHDIDDNLISPMFADIYNLYNWMNANGWKIDEYKDGEFIPWRVSRDGN